jgi:hypothetical protein
MEITFATFFRREAPEDVQMAQNRHSSVVSWHHGISDSLTIFYFLFIYYLKKKKTQSDKAKLNILFFYSGMAANSFWT